MNSAKEFFHMYMRTCESYLEENQDLEYDPDTLLMWVESEAKETWLHEDTSFFRFEDGSVIAYENGMFYIP